MTFNALPPSTTTSAAAAAAAAAAAVLVLGETKTLLSGDLKDPAVVGV